MFSLVASWDLQHEIEQFLYYEAWLLDEGRLYDWLDLFTDDAYYWMPVRETVQLPEDEKQEKGLALSLFDDDKAFLTLRVKRLDTGLAHAEQPPSRTRHLITNVRVVDRASEGDVTVHSSFVVYQGRLERSDHLFSGKREDRLRRLESGWKIARRKIILDQALLPRTLSIFF
jgi:3-phenylpropionate/cinnamic acid dioxygenase small subunit